LAFLFRSQWPRGLRHEQPSPIRTLESCVRIQFEAYLSAFILFVLLCIGSGLAAGWSPVQGVPSAVYRIKKLKIGKSPTKGCTTIGRQILNIAVISNGFSCCTASY
jgi:hypothetical protein